MVSETSGLDSATLLNKELNLSHGECALRVINMNHGFGDLVRSVNILFVIGPHFWNTLINTTPSRDLAFFHLRFVHFEFDWGLSNDEHLLVLHVLLMVCAVDCSFDVILDLGLWALTNMCIFKVDWAGHTHRKLELERNSVGARSEEPTRDLENGLLVVSELVVALDTLRSLNSLRWITFLHRVESCESGLFLSLDLDFDHVSK